MKNLALRGFRLIFGTIMFAFGIVLTVNANVGYAPWDVFHAGLSRAIGISFGQASIITGVVVVTIVTIAGEKIGIGTLVSMLVTGLLIDLIFFLGIIPVASNLVVGLIMLAIGIFVLSAGTYYYMRSAFGAGPRDNLMVVLNRKTKLPIGVCRSLVELIVTLAGWLMGGMVGIGTLISVVAIGFCIQLTFALFKFKASEVEHETVAQTYRNFRSCLKKH